MNSARRKLLWTALALAATLVGSISFLDDVFAERYPSPNKQMDLGIAIKDVQCNESLVLVIRTNGSPACVTGKTVEKLDWKIIEDNFAKPELAQSSKNTESFEPYDPEGIPYVDHTESRILKRGPPPVKFSEDFYPDIAIKLDGALAVPPSMEFNTIAPKDVTSSKPLFYGNSTLDPNYWLPAFVPRGMELKVAQWEGDYDKYGGDWMEFMYAPNTSDLNSTSYRYEFFDTHYIGLSVNTVPYQTHEQVNTYFGFMQNQSASLNDNSNFEMVTVNGIKSLGFNGDPNVGEISGISHIDGESGVNVAISSNRYTVSELIPVLESISGIKNAR